MADRSQRSSVTGSRSRVTSTRRRERRVTELQAGRKGAMPWSGRKVAALAGVPLIGALLIGGTAWAVPSIEEKLERETIADLQAAGVDTSELTVDYRYRTGTISGSANADAETLLAAVSAAGMRSVEVETESSTPGPSADLADEQPVDEEEPAIATTTTAVAEPATTESTATEPAAPDGTVEVEAVIAPDAITLRGTVSSEQQRAALVDAATARANGVEVIDELTISDLGAPIEGADDAVAGLASLLGQLDLSVTGTAILTDESLSFDGLAPSAEVAAQVDLAVTAAAGDLEVESNVRYETQGESEAIAALAAELDAIGPVFFETSLNELDATGIAQLDQIVALLEANPDVSLTVAGHTDGRGADLSNGPLSVRRAEAAIAYLVDHGIAVERLVAEGRIATEPLGDDTTAEGRSLNRRASFEIIESVDSEG